MNTRGKTPAALGYHMPAEWENHEATWLGWPHNKTDWPGKFSPIPWVFGEMAKRISAGEIVRIIATTRVQQQAKRVLTRAGVNLGQIEFFNYPTNRGWTRDFGPIFVTSNKKPDDVAIARFRFTAWARYPDWKKDDAVPPKAAKKLGVPLIDAKIGDKDFVLEGGSIDVNGRGTVLTTEECLLHKTVQVRNPGFGKEEVEQALRDNLGVTNVLWLGDGIVGDDTHGHVDDLCRFVNPATVVLIQESNPKDVNYRPLHENRERLEGMKLENGSKIQVVPLPTPAPLYYDTMRLPASYANFYISNAAVIVPTFNDPNDRIALGTLSELFTDRPVVGIHAVDLVLGFGTLHCLTQQQPAP
ncbi:MAG: agmatine deiminase family protein [Ignavibacteriales bacterium]|nr:agmatine deiminase family protein [Ignavibacteriales bacterium]